MSYDHTKGLKICHRFVFNGLFGSVYWSICIFHSYVDLRVPHCSNILLGSLEQKCQSIKHHTVSGDIPVYRAGSLHSAPTQCVINKEILAHIVILFAYFIYSSINTLSHCAMPWCHTVSCNLWHHINEKHDLTLRPIVCLFNTGPKLVEILIFVCKKYHTMF